MDTLREWWYYYDMALEIITWGGIALLVLIYGTLMFWLIRETWRSHQQHKRAERSIKEWNDWKEGKGKFG